MSVTQNPIRNEKIFVAAFAVLIIVLGIIIQPRLRSNLGITSVRGESESSGAKFVERKYTDAVLDINVATEEELQTLPGIGPSKARAIVEYRKVQPFKQAEEIMNVPGIGPKTFEKLKNRIKVGESVITLRDVRQKQTIVETETKQINQKMQEINESVVRKMSTDQLIDINTASVDELEKLPGIGPAKAAEIIKYRTEKGPFKSVDELLKVKGIGPKTLEKIRPLVCVK